MNGYGRGQENGRSEALSSVITRETLGMTLLLFSAILLVISIIGPVMLGEIGVAINAFLMGIFGFFIYPLLVFGILVALKMITGKKIFSWKWALRIGCVLVPVFLIAHLATSSRFFGAGFGAYLGGCRHAADASVGGATGGGALFGLVVYPMRALLSTVGAYIIFSLLTALGLFFLLWSTPVRQAVKRPAREKTGGRAEKAERPAKDDAEDVTSEIPRPSYSYEPFAPADASPAAYDGSYPEPSRAPYQDPYRDHYRERPRYEQPRAEGRGSVYNAPYSGQMERYTPPVESPSSKPNDARDFLFGADPATNYRNNLAYNRDSQFNNRVRKSSIEPFPPIVPERPASYAQDYAARAETPRPQMPRKIVEQTPDSPSLNYIRPSYKTPDEPKKEERRDFYANDTEEEFSSAPNIRDIPDEPPARPSGFLRTERESDPFARTDRIEPPAREDPFARSDRIEPPVREDPFARTDRNEPPAREDPFARTDRNEPPAREDPFSRTDHNEPPVREDPFARTDRNEPPVREDPFARTDRNEPPAREDPFARTDRNEPSVREDPFARTDREELSLDKDPDRAEPDAGGTGFGGTDEEDAGGSRAIAGFRARADMFDDAEPDFGEDDFVREFPVRERRQEPSQSMPSAPAPKPKRHIYRPYQKPSMELFHKYDDRISVPPEEITRNSEIIVDTLAGFRVDAEIVHVTVGPAVTRYDIDIPRNIAVGMVTKRDREIAMRLHAKNGVNIYANNETGAVSIEVPNSVRATVGLASVMQSEEYQKDKPGALMFAIGKDVEGRNVCGNIPKMTHILVAGTTNAGKSVCLNSMIISLICKYSPEELRLILVDPKKVEFPVYEGLPHLMINEIIADAQKAITALNWAIKEMERRYDLFEQKTRSGTVVRNIDEYNEARTEDEDRLPKIVIIVDELADLMSVAKKDIEERIQRLTQKARAAGLHLVLATQRPSVDVITGVIKGNLPTRMAVRVIQEVDSRTILDESGAEKLLGMGDMLYKTGGMFNCLRVQGAFIDSSEVQAIVEDVKQKNEAYFDPEVADYINRTEVGGGDDGDAESPEDGAANAEYIRALSMVVKLGQASISLIQRRCSIGYNHAGKIIEWMELMGYISPFDGKAKARTVLLTKEEFESKYGPLD